MLKYQFGGGSISPAVAAHLKKRNAHGALSAVSPAVTSQIGGGSISPAVVTHLKKRAAAKK